MEGRRLHNLHQGFSTPLAGFYDMCLNESERKGSREAPVPMAPLPLFIGDVS